MTSNDELIYNKLRKLWREWTWLKDTTRCYDYKEYVTYTYGIKYEGSSHEDFSYSIIDEKKFAWFLLK